MSMQVKLLRALQEREVTPVGSDKTIKVNTRIIAATNQNLIDLIEKGEFREDLYYRLNVINLHALPLRERIGDIQLLAMHFLKKYSKKNIRTVKGFIPEAMEKLVNYHWPGNVRELMNTIERGVILSTQDYLGRNDIQLDTKFSSSSSHSDETLETDESEKTLYDVEKIAILRMLDKVGNNKSEAAIRLGITRRTLHLKLKNYGVMH
jgi:two-component system response regulator HydG